MALLQDMSEKFSALSGREKWLITAGGWVAIFFIILTAFLEPAFKTQASQTSQYQSLNQGISNTSNQIAKVSGQLKSDPNREVDAKLQQLQRRSDELSSQLDAVVESLVTPSQMAELLERVLLSSKGLKLENLQSMPAEPIMAGSDSQAVGYYIHPVKIEITGKYFDIKNYLVELESMPTTYFWRSYQYEVEEYPTARLVLVVYTLGTGQEFIGG
ncbi:putative MSHA biogenesis protein MshJ [Vibrio nigripulchritudo SO65]|uniref:type 4a pilus biogenesis protein PilO n=1 Tax=Vibrio nigripulchritudo TaxID=28173 RepID=UPI0003B20A55|nr:type 4a pilus biogenesis protein PilO [Vibrio nigripulchritudo]CCN37931.1 putative MSHA biogenesis protein MshJ [Vibrio nigripulchritudo AM115]CCN38949.1 putative MSHA biogenesis protein MshJ [Vibrio nigripulchritudo FTn2]CCN64069.1 putative MSHA biogenesis protein MshJ [Vibrio nigripulchritudo POn4]CCN76416.1 putative MSHA biogenesis protein MshJ [Vibrio nigripulchritudo SO65]